MFNLDNDSLRVLIFFGVLFICCFTEFLIPRKNRTQPRLQRWLTNISLIVINGVVIKLMAPIAAVSAAAYAAGNDWGLFALWSWPSWLEILLAVALLDFSIYIQHLISHKIPILWRLHRVHHTDRDIDATTGVRFHPIEIMLSMLYKVLVVLLLGPAVLAVFLFEVLLNSSAMFNHANIKLPQWLDSIIRIIIVTPDMHRVHHSVIQKETDSNYGFCLSIWDKCFGTYIAQPEKGHDDMIIGLESYQSSQPSQIGWCLKLPFSK